MRNFQDPVVKIQGLFKHIQGFLKHAIAMNPEELTNEHTNTLRIHEQQ